MPTKHKLSPSASARYLTCTASLQFNKDGKENKVALEGTLMHEVASLRLEQLFFDKDNTELLNKLTDYKNPYPSRKEPTLVAYWQVRNEQIVSDYVNYVKKVAVIFNAKEVYIEYKIKMRWYGNTIYGTVDLVMIDAEGNIYIIDLKTGRNKVNTLDNNQMLMYAYGIMQDIYKQTNVLPKKITISISQSVAFNTQAVEYTLKELLDWYKSHAQAMKEINTDNLVYRPNPEACKYCSNRTTCQARIEKGVV